MAGEMPIQKMIEKPRSETIAQPKSQARQGGLFNRGGNNGELEKKVKEQADTIKQMEGTIVELRARIAELEGGNTAVKVPAAALTVPAAELTKPRFGYWDVWGLGQAIRVQLAYQGVDFEDF